MTSLYEHDYPLWAHLQAAYLRARQWDKLDRFSPRPVPGRWNRRWMSNSDRKVEFLACCSAPNAT